LAPRKRPEYVSCLDDRDLDAEGAYGLYLVGDVTGRVYAVVLLSHQGSPESLRRMRLYLFSGMIVFCNKGP
jgi:hypothetical protein